MKPDHIPQDLWDKASSLATTPGVEGGLFTDNYVLPLAEALLAERKGSLPVQGYTPQPDAKVALVNSFKQDEERLLRKLDDLTVQRTFRANSNGESSITDSEPEVHVDQRWLAIGRTQLQEAFMSINRAVFQPTRIKLPEDDNR